MKRRIVSIAIAMAVVLAAGVLASACGPTLTTYTTSGNTIYEPGSTTTPYLPYGYVMPCLSFTSNMNTGATQTCNGNDPNGNNQTWQSMLDYAEAQQANTVRLQVSPSDYFYPASAPWTTSSTPNSAYLGIIDSIVYTANVNHMAVIITDQEENDSKSPGPQMGRDDQFWNSIAAHYATAPKVMFDLYNEPYGDAMAGFDCSVPAQQAAAWAAWQSGTGGYLTMQSLASTVRNVANNLIIAEGVCHDQDLSGIPGHTLTGGNIAYGFEPNLTSNGTSDGSGNDRNATQQEQRFGKYHDGTVASLPLMPEAFVGYYLGGHCDPWEDNGYPGNPNDVNGMGPNTSGDFVALVENLHSMGLGMIMFSLDPGTGPQYSATQFSSAAGTPTSATGWGVSPWVATNCPNGAGDPTHTPFGMGGYFSYFSSLWSVGQ